MKKDWSTHKPRCRELRRGLSETSRPRGKEVCTVCSARVSNEATARRLRCGHLFHSACVGRWLERRGTCPSCDALHRYVKVKYRGHIYEVEVEGDDMELETATLRMLDQFFARFDLFYFRQTPDKDADTWTITWALGKKPIKPSTKVKLLETVRGAARDRGDVVPAVVEVAVDIPSVEQRISHEHFQWARIDLPKPDNIGDWEILHSWPNGCHPFYRRPANWIEVAHEEHRNGLCGLSRVKRVKHLETELAHDYLADWSDDAAWEARRPLYVELHQALAACRSDDGFWDKDVPYDFPVTTTWIHPPPGREYDEFHIIDEASWAAPVNLYGCPFIHESQGAYAYVCGLLHRAEITIAMKHERTDSLKMMDDPDIVRHCAFRGRGSYIGDLCSELSHPSWSAQFKKLAAGIIVVVHCEGGHLICFNRYHSEFYKLPAMSVYEAVLPMPFDYPRKMAEDPKQKSPAKKERRARRKARS